MRMRDDERKPVGSSMSRYRRLLYTAAPEPTVGRCRHGVGVGQCGLCKPSAVRDDPMPPSDGGKLPDALLRWILRNRTTKPRDKRNVRREPNRQARQRFASSGERRIERLEAVAAERICAGTAVCECIPWRRNVCDWCALVGSIRDAKEQATWRQREVRRPVSGRLPLDND